MAIIPQDAATNAWAYRLSPVKFHPYIALMRLDRPIGVWLLFWPCVWGVGLANGDNQLLHIVLFFIGACAMRAAGCVWNDILDRKIDASVERTKNRPLANGTINVKQALVCMGILCAMGLCVLLCFNRFTIYLGLCSLLLVAIYPLAKHFTNYPQIILGFTFNWGVLLGFAATNETINVAALFLYGSGIFWTLGYDTIYAMQDKKDDAIIGIGSTALAFGNNANFWILGFYGAAILCALAALMRVEAGAISYLALLAFAAHLIWQNIILSQFGSESALPLFKSNAVAGGILALGFMFG